MPRPRVFLQKSCRNFKPRLVESLEHSVLSDCFTKGCRPVVMIKKYVLHDYGKEKN